jgi:hypothetical protein
MSLTEKQIKKYREKLKDSRYMKKAINGVAVKFLTGSAMVEPTYAEPETNDTEEKVMAKNSMQDLNDHLFERIEWLTDKDNVKGAELEEEIKRTEAVVKVAVQIAKNAEILLKAKALVKDTNGKISIPTMLEDKAK